MASLPQKRLPKPELHQAVALSSAVADVTNTQGISYKRRPVTLAMTLSEDIQVTCGDKVTDAYEGKN